MGDQVLLTVKKISKAFGPTRALIDVDIELRRGEIRGLIGENGSEIGGGFSIFILMQIFDHLFIDEIGAAWNRADESSPPHHC